MARAPKTAPILETERLRLRPFKAGDLKALHTLYADAENLRYWGTDPSPSPDETRRAKRLGFRLEGGPIRDRWWVGGKWHSVMLYGLVAGEEK